MKYFLSIIIVTLMAGCSYIPTYETFRDANDLFVQERNQLTYDWVKRSYQKTHFSDSEHIYIYKSHRVDSRCVWGYLADKDDPRQIAKSWVILSGKEFCKQVGTRPLQLF